MANLLPKTGIQLPNFHAFHSTSSSRLRLLGRMRICIHSNTTPPTTAANPPATDQSGDSMAAAALVAAVVAELEVAVLVFEVVLDVEATYSRADISSCSSGIQFNRESLVDWWMRILDYLS